MAIGVNAVFILLLVSGRTSHQRELPVTAMLWMVAELEQSRPPARRAVTSRRAQRGEGPVVASIPVPLTTAISTQLPSPLSDAPAANPYIDWQAEAGEAAQRVVDDMKTESTGAPADAGSSIQVRPESFWIPRKKGTVERMPGGASRVWTSDLCYREYNPLEPDPFTGRYREGGRTVCKPRNAADRQSEARAEAIADAVRRKRSPAR
jgi:hypothetical protein